MNGPSASEDGLGILAEANVPQTYRIHLHCFNRYHPYITSSLFWTHQRQQKLPLFEPTHLPSPYADVIYGLSHSNWDECQEWMRRYPNLKVGFTPMITFAKNRHLHDVIRKIPLSRILLETDSPYFLPRQEPTSLTGGMSHPGFVIHTAAQIAQLKKVPIRDVIEANKRNVLEIYGIVTQDPLRST